MSPREKEPLACRIEWEFDESGKPKLSVSEGCEQSVDEILHDTSRMPDLEDFGQVVQVSEFYQAHSDDLPTAVALIDRGGPEWGRWKTTFLSLREDGRIATHTGHYAHSKEEAEDDFVRRVRDEETRLQFATTRPMKR